MKKYKIYIAGPLSASAVGYLHNVHTMMTQAEQIRKLGFSVYVPAIDLLMGIKFGYESYSDYFDNSQPWLLAADAVFVYDGWVNSPGTLKEVELALTNNIPVFDDIDQLVDHFKVIESKGDHTYRLSKIDSEISAIWDEMATEILKQIKGN